MTQLTDGGRQPRDREERSHSASAVAARRQRMAGTSRVNREVYARFCGRLEVQFLRPTRRGSAPEAIMTRGEAAPYAAVDQVGRERVRRAASEERVRARFSLPLPGAPTVHGKRKREAHQKA